MKDESWTRERLEEILDRESDRHPSSQPLLEAFRPVILARHRLMEGLQLPETAPLTVDTLRFQGGIPVIGQIPLLREEDPWKEIVRAMIPAVREGFPDLSDDLERFDHALAEGKIALADYFTGNPDAQQDLLSTWAESLSFDGQRIVFVLNQAIRIVLEKRAREIAERIKDLTWEKGYCPICGSFPSLSVIGEKIGDRWLHCSHCNHDWRFSRVICPYCEHAGPEGMDFVLIEEKPQETAFICDQCRRYLITLHRVSDLNDRDLDVSALGLTHLDLILQEKDFLPITVTDWNVF